MSRISQLSQTLLAILTIPFCLSAAADGCQSGRVELKVLGSGGPELNDGRASSSYLIFLDGKARVMVDAGGGSSLNFERSGAQFEDLDAVLFTHLHVDHVADWPVYVKGGFFSRRQQDLSVFGPDGNQLLPDIGSFQSRLFAEAWPYLKDNIDASPAAYKLPSEIINASDSVWRKQLDGFSLSAIEVNHGPLPAIAWRVNIVGCAITFSGDTSARTDRLIRLAQGSDLLVAHNAIPEDASGVARRLHMPPSRIGVVAEAAGVGGVVLSHRMNRTLGREDETLRHIALTYSGKVEFAEDLSSHSVERH